MTLSPPDVPDDPQGGGESISAARSAPVGTSKAAEVAAMDVKTGVQQERLGNEAEAAQREQQSVEELAACELLSLAPETA